MEGLTQEDNENEVIVIDDSFDDGIPGDETIPCNGNTSETGSEPSKSETVPGGCANSETAPGWSSEPEIPPSITEKSLAKHAVTIFDQVKTVGFKGRVIHVHADLPVSSGGRDSGRNTSSEHLHREELSDASSLENEQQHNTDLTAETCQSSIGESSMTECTPVNGCSDFSASDSNAIKADTSRDSGKAAKSSSSPEKSSSENEPVDRSLDSKSAEKSSDGTPLKCSLHNESTSSDVQNDCQVIPASSKELNSLQVPSEATGKQLTPPGTNTASHKCGQELLPQNQQAARYIIIHNKNTAGKQEAARKPGDKLTSLLQRLTSGKLGKVSVQLPIMTNPLSVPDTKAEANQSSLSVSPAASVGSIQDKPAVSQHAVTEISPRISEISPRISEVSPRISEKSPRISKISPRISEISPRISEISPIISEKPTVKFSAVSKEPFPISTPKLPPKTDSSTKADESPSLLKAETSKTVSLTSVTVPATVFSGRDPVPQVRYGTQAKKGRQISTSLLQMKPAEVFMKSGKRLLQVFGTVDDSKQASAILGFPALIPASKLKHVLSCLPVQGSMASNIVFKGPEGQNIQPLQGSSTSHIVLKGPEGQNILPVQGSGTSNIVLKGPEGQNILPVQGSRTSNIVFKGPEGQNILHVQGSPTSDIVLKGPEGQNIVPVQGSRTSNIVLKGPKGQNILPVQGSTASNIVLKGPKGQNILLGKAMKAYLPQPFRGHKTPRKSKYQFSLLQNPSGKTSEALQVSASLKAGARKPSSTVRSLLATSTTIAPVLYSSKVPTSETPNANTSTSLFNIGATMAVQGVEKSTAISNTWNKKRTRTHTKQYKLAKPSQVLLPPLSQPAAVTASGNNSSPAATTVTFSKLAVPPSSSKGPLSKACIVPVSSSTAGRPIFVMSTSGSPVPALLIPPSGVNSKSLLAPGRITYNNISAFQTSFVTKTPEVNPTIQSSANTAHTFSELISRIALQTVPSTSANKPSSGVNSDMQALNLALLHQLRQQNGVPAAPVRIIVSQGSGVKPTAKLIYAQSPSDVYPCGTVTTQARKAANVSKTVPRAMTVAEVSSKQVPKLIYPKPVSSDEANGAPAKAKSVSLLNMSLVRKNQTTSNCHGNATVADSSQVEDVKPKGSQIVGVCGLKETSANNTIQKSKKDKASPRAPVSRKRKNAVYTAILRTGQGPVSVRLVAPNMDEDSSDTMSDTGLANVMLSDESAFTTEDSIGKASDVDSGPSVKLFESDMPDLLCSEHLANSGPETDDGAELNTELQDLESSAEPAVSHRHHHHVQDLSGEETDTDTEMMATEEQDMSVLRQLLTNTGAKSLCSSETTQKVYKFSAASDLMSGAGNQSDNALSADCEGLASLPSNSESISSLDQAVIEEDGGAESCDLKIESVFSLRDPGDCQDTELPADGQAYQELSGDEAELLPMFNVRTSDDWKSFLNPCFVVLERLSKSELFVRGNAKVTSKCSGHCRKRTLDYLCNLNLLRCVNHPDPFLFQKPKMKRGPVKKTLKEMIRHEVIKEKCMPEDNSNSFQIMKDVYGQTAADESVMVMKTADLARVMSKFFPVVKDVGKSPSVIKYVSKSPSVIKDISKSPSMIKDISKSPSVIKDISKSPSVMKETCVKRSGKLPLVVKATARKTMNKSAPKVNLTFAKKPFSLVSHLTKEAHIKASIGELQMKELGLKETLSTSPLLVNEMCTKDESQLSQKVPEACVESPMTKPSAAIKDVVKTMPECSLLLAKVNQELPDPPPETAFVSDTVHVPATSSRDLIAHASTAQDDQKTNDGKTSDLDSVCSGPKSSKFSRALKQLQKQINKKRVAMLTEKLNRKKHRGSSKKQNVRKCKIKLSGQKHKNKVAVKRLRKKRLSKNVLVSADMVRILSESRNAHKRARLSAAGKRHIHLLPHLDHNISHNNSLVSILPKNKKLCSTESPGMKPSSDPRTTPLANVQIKNIKSKGQFVRLQPKMTGIPQEKVQSALQSLNSYLAATGRKPTTGNTQFILLKIDDQHVLVKWPATSVPLTPQTSTPNIKITPVTSSADSTQSKWNSDASKDKQKEAVSITAAGNFNNICNTLHSFASTSTRPATAANVNSTFAVTNPTSNITFLTNVKPNSESSVLTSGSTESTPGMGKKGIRIIRTKQVVMSSQSSGKSSPCSASSMGTQQHGNNVIIDASNAGITNPSKSALKTGPSLNKQTVISLLKSGALSQAQSNALTTFMRSASPIVTSVISSPVVSGHYSQASSTAPGGFKKAAGKDTNFTLSRLPPNSMLLPGRKRPNTVLTEEERLAKRRRLEEKYPLPPGVVIKSEPDDLENYLVSPGISPAFTANTSLMPTECTESLEPLIMSGDDQAWSVENSVNIGSYLTDSDYPAQEHTAVQGVPVDCAVEDNLSSESCLNAEDSSDEQDEPPALLDETLDDGDEDVQIEDITDAQEDAPPVLQPMFTSSSCSLLKDSDTEEFESTECAPEMSADVTTFVPYDRHIGRAGEPRTSADSISVTSLYSENSMDSGVDTNCPSTSFSHTSTHGQTVDRLSHTSTHGQTADRPVSKNLKIQYLKDLLRKKEMEIENMKKVQSELVPADFDI